MFFCMGGKTSTENKPLYRSNTEYKGEISFFHPAKYLISTQRCRILKLWPEKTAKRELFGFI
jgi:hypothetical protein